MTTTSLPPTPTHTVATRRRVVAGDERSLFLLGTALVALHVVDDSFLQPPAGTSAADHLVGGLVPVALLAAAAWAYGRVRAGWRGGAGAGRRCLRRRHRRDRGRLLHHRRRAVR